MKQKISLFYVAIAFSIAGLCTSCSSDDPVDDTGGGTNNPGNNNQTNTSGNNENKEELPETLPKTGTTQYVYVITAIAVLGATYIAVKNIKEDKKQKK